MGKEKSVKETFKEVLDMLEEAKQTHQIQENLDYDTVIVDVENAISQIDEELEALHKKTGMTREQLESYTADEKNFSPEEWKMLEQIRSQISSLEVSKEGAEEVAQSVSPKKKKKRKHWKQA